MDKNLDDWQLLQRALERGRADSTAQHEKPRLGPCAPEASEWLCAFDQGETEQLAEGFEHLNRLLDGPAKKTEPPTD